MNIKTIVFVLLCVITILFSSLFAIWAHEQVHILNNEECCFVHYPEIKEALLALEQKEKLSKWLDDVEGFETKEFRDTLEKSLFGKLVGTCKVREIMNLKKEKVGEQK